VSAPEAAPAPKPWEKFAQPKEKVVQEQRVDFLTRAGLKNLIGDSPKLQAEYLNKKGFQTRLEDGQLQVKKSGDKDWGVVDPEGFDMQDVTDLVGDVAEMALTGLGALAGATLGPVGAVAGGAAATGAAETARQAAAKATGLREEFDPSQVAKSAALGAAIPAGLGLAGAAAKGMAKFGKQAAGKTLEIGTRQISKMGPEKFREIGQMARKEGLVDIFRGVEGSLKKAQAKVAEIGKNLEAGYKKLDDRVITRIKAKDLTESLVDQSGKKFPDPRATKALKRELDNLLSTKKDLKPSEMWGLAKELNKRAGTFSKPGTNQDFTKAGMLEESAGKIREHLKRMANARGLKSIAEDSQKFHKMKIVEDALDSKLAGQLGKSSVVGTKDIKDLAFDVVGDVVHKSVAKVGGVAEKLTPLANTKAAAALAPTASIAERLSKLDEK
jgi:hypothetical protein